MSLPLSIPFSLFFFFFFWHIYFSVSPLPCFSSISFHLFRLSTPKLYYSFNPYAPLLSSPLFSSHVLTFTLSSLPPLLIFLPYYHIHTRTCTRTRRHARTHARTHTHTHSQEYTFPHILLFIILSFLPSFLPSFLLSFLPSFLSSFLPFVQNNLISTLIHQHFCLSFIFLINFLFLSFTSTLHFQYFHHLEIYKNN